MLLRDDGKYECAICGVLIDLPKDTRPTSMLCGASGKPNVRILSVDGTEIHRCTVTLAQFS